MSEGAVKKAIHDLRKRYRKLLRAEIAATVSSPEEEEEEIQHLISVASR
jgi:RNA polymerase sigma-70 factor (ECF subfamily)